MSRSIQASHLFVRGQHDCQLAGSLVRTLIRSAGNQHVNLFKAISIIEQSGAINLIRDDIIHVGYHAPLVTLIDILLI